jgi:hypothetical protein
MRTKEDSMCKGARQTVLLGLALVFLIFTFPQLLRANDQGNLVGFVFAKDGATPIEGAVVFVKNVTTGAIHESTKSDHLGIFKVEKLGVGIYALGVTSDQGDYNSQDFVGIAPNETAKVTIALNPYDEEAIAAAQTVAQEQREAGESLVGKVIRYVPQGREAEIFIERGLIQAGDRLHIKGSSDFFQDARRMKVEGESARRILSTQSGSLPVSRACAPGDLVYVVCKKGVPPFFLLPLGIASVVAGSATLATIEEEDTSPFKIKK